MRLLEIKSLIESRTMDKVLIAEPDRAMAFLKMIADGTPFPIKTKPGKEPQPDLIADPSEYDRFNDMIANDTLKGAKLKGIDGREITINNLEKTKELGGKEAEKIPVKPGDIFAGEKMSAEEDILQNLGRAGAFPASELNNKIQTNTKLDEAGDIGRGIKEIAAQIDKGQVPIIPSYLTPDMVKAIELYAGEYLGVLAVLNNTAKFNKREAFDEFLGINLADLMLYFPKTVSNPLADSYAIQNKTNGHSIKISSKAAGTGAAPALEGLKLPDEVRSDPRFAREVEFFDKALDEQLSAFTQPFALMNWVYSTDPSMVAKEFLPYLPWTKETMAELTNALKKKTPLNQKMMDAAISLIPKGRPNGPDAGVLWWSVTQDVINTIVKKGFTPNFKTVVLETLGYNFVQIYTNVKGNKLETTVLWPGKVDGKVSLRTKGYAAAPNAKLSFQITK